LNIKKVSGLLGRGQMELHLEQEGVELIWFLGVRDINKKSDAHYFF